MGWLPESGLARVRARLRAARAVSSTDRPGRGRDLRGRDRPAAGRGRGRASRPGQRGARRDEALDAVRGRGRELDA